MIVGGVHSNSIEVFEKNEWIEMKSWELPWWAVDGSTVQYIAGLLCFFGMQLSLSLSLSLSFRSSLLDHGHLR